MDTWTSDSALPQDFILSTGPWTCIFSDRSHSFGSLEHPSRAMRNTIIIIAHIQEAGMSTRGPQYIQGFDSGTTPDANGSHLTGFSSWNEEAPEMNRAAKLHDPGHGFGSSTCNMS
ncbi:unnamed protein product [Clonostachys rosea f. rosea IK726]|uniref:Uncharacterized protein n=1 Tax=Clonostachys rosea f. rosea IK726 TaxID=1349383 RepID=A0ACA9T9I2_BIOOC|nr:unnamed protein product [Clonostachys rosea f. rosea IK726]